jgi:ATP-dependent RNA helicase DDX23/PRP28
MLYGYTNDHSHAEISKSPVSKVSPELAKHEAAQHKVSREMKRKRDADDIG